MKKISNSIEADHLIDSREFQRALQIKNTGLVKRIFTIFDKNKDGVINFSVLFSFLKLYHKHFLNVIFKPKEFIVGMSKLTPKASFEDKVQCTPFFFDFLYFREF